MKYEITGICLKTYVIVHVGLVETPPSHDALRAISGVQNLADVSCRPFHERFS